VKCVILISECTKIHLLTSFAGGLLRGLAILLFGPRAGLQEGARGIKKGRETGL